MRIIYLVPILIVSYLLFFGSSAQLRLILEHVLRIKIMTSFVLDHVARAYLYLGISTGEKVMILLLSHSLGVVTGQNKT